MHVLYFNRMDLNDILYLGKTLNFYVEIPVRETIYISSVMHAKKVQQFFKHD